MERVKFFWSMQSDGREGKEDAFEEHLNQWLSDNDGKIEIVSRHMAVDEDGNPLVSIFYHPLSSTKSEVMEL